MALFSLNGQYHFLPVSNSVVIFSSILAVIGLNILFKPSKKAKATWNSYSAGSSSQTAGNDIDVSFSTVTKYLNDQNFTGGSADVSLGEASIYFDKLPDRRAVSSVCGGCFPWKFESLCPERLAGSCQCRKFSVSYPTPGKS